MRHKLDIHPVPEEVLYINELSLAENVPYETKDTMEKAVTGKCVRDSGILPDDVGWVQDKTADLFPFYY